MAQQIDPEVPFEFMDDLSLIRVVQPYYLSLKDHITQSLTALSSTLLGFVSTLALA